MTSPKIGPFYTSAMNFYRDVCAARGDYTCIVCQTGTMQTDDVAISYATGRATFSHAACLTSAGISISEDKRARQKAKQKAKDAIKALKSLSTAPMAPALPQTPPAIAGGAPAPDESVPVDEAELRAIIEAEYDDLLGQAIDRLQTMSALIESLQAENRRLVAQNAVAALAPASVPPAATEAAPAATEAAPAAKPRCQTCNKMAAADGYCKNHRPADGTVHISTSEIADQHLCRVCQKPARKDSDTCKLHQFAAPEGAFTPSEPVAMRPKDGTFDVTFVGLAPNDMMVRLHQPGVVQNQYSGPCSYLMADSGVTRAFKSIAPGSLVRIALKDSKVVLVTTLKDSKAA